MKVILQRDIPKVGRGGDIVVVKDGYARNYLFPRTFAVAASGSALKEHIARAAREKERDGRLLASAQADADKIADLTITVTAKVGGGSKLYGSITAQDVADAILRERGLTVDKRRIGLADPIRSLGQYTVPVRVHSEMTVNVTVDVATDEELERRKKVAAAEAAAAAVAAAAAEAAAE